VGRVDSSSRSRRIMGKKSTASWREAGDLHRGLKRRTPHCVLPPREKQFKDANGREVGVGMILIQRGTWELEGKKEKTGKTLSGQSKKASRERSGVKAEYYPGGK